MAKSEGGIARKRGRPAVETPEDRLARLERQMEEARQEIAENRQRMFGIVGATLVAEAETDSELKTRMVEILRRRVTDARSKSYIAPLLIEPHPQAKPDNAQTRAEQKNAADAA